MSKIIASSGLYNYQTIQAELLIREAFELIGIPGSLVVLEQLEGAARSINFLLTDLVNQNINLWTLQRVLFSLTPGVTSYLLANTLVKVLQVNLRNSYRELNSATATEIPKASTGIAGNAFDADSTTACTQTLVNGYIYYQFTTPQQITFLGIQSNTTRTYTLQLSASNTGVDNSWINLNTPIATAYAEGTIVWFDISNINNYLYYKITEIGGAFLDITEIYLNDQVVDTALSEITLDAYLRLPIKTNIGRPTIYAIDYQIIPQLNLWQAPDNQYNCLVINYQNMIQSLSSYTESINIPNYFYQAIIYGLAKSLAMKYAPDKLQYIGPEYDRALQLCLTKNTNTLPLNFKLHVN